MSEGSGVLFEAVREVLSEAYVVTLVNRGVNIIQYSGHGLFGVKVVVCVGQKGE